MKKFVLVLTVMLMTGSVVSAEVLNNAICPTKPKGKSKISSAGARQSGKINKNVKITFLEIGSVNCRPCKMMQPVMKEIEERYTGEVVVIFNDVSTTAGSITAQKYGVQMIPTQVFLDGKGEEFFRHTGFYPASEIAKVLDMKLGKNAGNI